MAKPRRSRLQRKEEKRNIRQAIILSFLTLAISIGLIFMGIPILIKAAIFLGEIRGSTQPIESQDSLPPMPPRLQALPKSTSSSSIDISGYSEPGAEIEIFINKKSVLNVVVENDGTFQANNVSLSPDENQIYAQATDRAGNKSQPSQTLYVLLDKEPPELEITQPENGADFFGQDQTVNISGQTEPRVTVMINERIVIVDSEGKFDYPIRLEEGENVIKVSAEDKAGNKTEKEITLTYSP